MSRSWVRDDQNRIRLTHESLERRVGHVERDYTTKEEWLREAALTRRQLDKIENLLVGLHASGDAEGVLALQLGRLAAAGEMVKALIQDRDPHDFSELQLVALTRLVEALHMPGLKPSTIATLTQQINAFEKQALENHKDEREQQTHEMRLQIEAAKAKVAEAAKTDKSGEKVVDLATVAKLLGEVDLA